jgi:hypothetical protein
MTMATASDSVGFDWIGYDTIRWWEYLSLSAICCEFVSAWERKKQIASAASGQGKQGSVHASILESSDLSSLSSWDSESALLATHGPAI